MFLQTLWILFGIFVCDVVTARACGFLNITRQPRYFGYKIIFIISPGTFAFSLGEGEKMAAPHCCASKTLRTPSYPLTRCGLSRSFLKIKA